MSRWLICADDETRDDLKWHHLLRKQEQQTSLTSVADNPGAFLCRKKNKAREVQQGAFIGPGPKTWPSLCQMTGHIVFHLWLKSLFVPKQSFFKTEKQNSQSFCWTRFFPLDTDGRQARRNLTSSFPVCSGQLTFFLLHVNNTANQPDSATIVAFDGCFAHTTMCVNDFKQIKPSHNHTLWMTTWSNWFPRNAPVRLYKSWSAQVIVFNTRGILPQFAANAKSFTPLLKNVQPPVYRRTTRAFRSSWWSIPRQYEWRVNAALVWFDAESTRLTRLVHDTSTPRGTRETRGLSVETQVTKDTFRGVRQRLIFSNCDTLSVRSNNPDQSGFRGFAQQETIPKPSSTASCCQHKLWISSSFTRNLKSAAISVHFSGGGWGCVQGLVKWAGVSLNYQQPWQKKCLGQTDTATVAPKHGTFTYFCLNHVVSFLSQFSFVGNVLYVSLPIRHSWQHE